MNEELFFPFNIYYHPYFTLEQKDSSKKKYHFLFHFEKKEELVKHLPPEIQQQYPLTINYSIQDNSYLRNDRMINFLRTAARTNQAISCFFMDSEEHAFPHGEGRFKILSIGDAYQQCTHHDPYAPINVHNKNLLTKTFLEYSVKPVVTKRKILKF